MIAIVGLTILMILIVGGFFAVKYYGDYTLKSKRNAETEKSSPAGVDGKKTGARGKKTGPRGKKTGVPTTPSPKTNKATTSKSVTVSLMSKSTEPMPFPRSLTLKQPSRSESILSSRK